MHARCTLHSLSDQFVSDATHCTGLSTLTDWLDRPPSSADDSILNGRQARVEWEDNGEWVRQSVNQSVRQCVPDRRRDRLRSIHSTMSSFSYLSSISSSLLTIQLEVVDWFSSSPSFSPSSFFFFFCSCRCPSRYVSSSKCERKSWFRKWVHFFQRCRLWLRSKFRRQRTMGGNTEKNIH